MIFNHFFIVVYYLNKNLKKDSKGIVKNTKQVINKKVLVNILKVINMV